MFRVVAILASLVLASVLPATAAPLAGLPDLVGTWKCTYRAGATSLPYTDTYAYDRDSHTLRQIATFAGGADEELLTYDAHRGGWTATILDDHGNATVMRGTGRDPNHIVYHSVYPDASIAETFVRVSAREYTLHATTRSGGKTMANVDTCLRAAL